MANNSNITIPRLDEWVKRIGDAADLKFVTAALEAGALYLKGKLATYPPARHLTRKSVYGQTFQSDKQRIAFFGKLKRGEIQVPYVRGSSPGSETLGKKWTIDTRSATEVVLGNNVSYAPLVQGYRQDQSMYMRMAGWRSVDDILEDEGPTVVKQIEKEFDARFRV